jgi:hypothetical protein
MDRCEALQYEIAILEQSILDAKNFKHTAYDDIPELIVVSNLPRINTESAKKETGGKIGSKKDISPSLVSKKGPSVERAAEQIVEKYGADGEGILTKDGSWVRGEIIEILKTGKANYKKDILADIKELKLKVLDLEKELKSSCLGNEGYSGFWMSKEEVLKEAIEFQNTRSKRARAIDERSGNKRRLSPTAENLLRWMKNPSRFDLIGVDAYRAKRPTADLEIDLETWWRGQRLPDKPKKQGYNARKDESMTSKKGRKSSKKSKQSLKSRRDESAGMEKKLKRRKYASVGTMDKASGTRLYKIPYSGMSGEGSYYVTIASGADAAKNRFYEDMLVTDKIEGKAMPTTYKFIENKNMIKSVKEGGFARVFPVKKKSSSKPKKASGSRGFKIPNPRKDTVEIKPFGGRKKPLKLGPFDYSLADKKGGISYDYFGQKFAHPIQYKIL